MNIFSYMTNCFIEIRAFTHMVGGLFSFNVNITEIKLEQYFSLKLSKLWRPLTPKAGVGFQNKTFWVLSSRQSTQLKDHCWPLLALLNRKQTSTAFSHTFRNIKQTLILSVSWFYQLAGKKNFILWITVIYY